MGAIDRMSKELQELVQRDAGTDGEEEAYLVLTSTNLDEEELALGIEASIFLPFAASTAGPTPSHWFIPPIPEEEEVSVKDSVTSGLPSKEQNMGAKASGSGRQPTLSVVGGPKAYTPMSEDTEDVKKLAFVP